MTDDIESNDTPYTVTTTTKTGTYVRGYHSLDPILELFTNYQSAGHSGLITIADAPIVVVNPKEIVSILVAGTTAGELRLRQEQKYRELEQQKQAEYSRQFANQSAGYGALVSGNRIGGLI
ncbi:hypothetical protein [Limnoglobus roseus]|uniref:Uncharacterized protein n=1 Tax=Limnoglobus roseus TaxID=2598579 RepID=A0A5C1AJE0_9BACT|nr:hypothetical protein [Limnoglobus roseus]QEL19311.1 hypothetical protein PX52LOC_06376 [Limnoglobus roseus]